MSARCRRLSGGALQGEPRDLRRRIKCGGLVAAQNRLHCLLTASFHYAFKGAHDFGSGQVCELNMTALFDEFDQIVIAGKLRDVDGLRTACLYDLVSVDRAGNTAACICGTFVALTWRCRSLSLCHGRAEPGREDDRRQESHAQSMVHRTLRQMYRSGKCIIRVSLAYLTFS